MRDLVQVPARMLHRETVLRDELLERDLHAVVDLRLRDLAAEHAFELAIAFVVEGAVVGGHRGSFAPVAWGEARRQYGAAPRAPGLEAIQSHVPSQPQPLDGGCRGEASRRNAIIRPTRRPTPLGAR